MRPSQYNYLKRTFTRTMAKNNGCLMDFILLPFKICIFIIIGMVIASFYVLYYAIIYFLKFIFAFAKFLFKYTKLFFIGLITFAVRYLKREHIILKDIKEEGKKIKKEKEIKEYVKNNEEINIPDMMKEFDITYSSEAIKLVLEAKNPESLRD